FSVKYKHEKAHEDGIWCCAWGRSENGDVDYVMTGSLDNGLKVWKWVNDHLESLHSCEGHRLGVISVDINSAGSMAASSSLDSQVI
ncbi:WD repeat-containing protein 61, partial [Paragonimus westermani]